MGPLFKYVVFAFKHLHLGMTNCGWCNIKIHKLACWQSSGFFTLVKIIRCWPELPSAHLHSWFFPDCTLYKCCTVQLLMKAFACCLGHHNVSLHFMGLYVSVSFVCITTCAHTALTPPQCMFKCFSIFCLAFGTPVVGVLFQMNDISYYCRGIVCHRKPLGTDWVGCQVSQLAWWMPATALWFYFGWCVCAVQMHHACVGWLRVLTNVFHKVWYEINI